MQYLEATIDWLGRHSQRGTGPGGSQSGALAAAPAMRRLLLCADSCLTAACCLLLAWDARCCSPFDRLDRVGGHQRVVQPDRVSNQRPRPDGERLARHTRPAAMFDVPDALDDVPGQREAAAAVVRLVPPGQPPLPQGWKIPHGRQGAKSARKGGVSLPEKLLSLQPQGAGGARWRPRPAGGKERSRLTRTPRLRHGSGPPPCAHEQDNPPQPSL